LANLPYSVNEEKRRTLMIEGLFQPMHLLVIFGIALLVFGPKKLPELGKGIGDGIRGFKTAIKQIDEGSENSTKP
jgi:sec-independent protein translocase protein TatA